MKHILYCMVQCTWGILQSTLGLFNFMLHIRSRHYFYHGAVITEWNDKSSVSLGMFVFVTKEPYFYDKLKSEYTMEELSQSLCLHKTLANVAATVGLSVAQQCVAPMRIIGSGVLGCTP